MAWPFKKNEKEAKDSLAELPELPPMPELPFLARPRTELPALPSFPISQAGEKISREAVKDIVLDYSPEAEEPAFARKPVTKEIEMPGFKEPAKMPNIMKEEPIFIRIDKYNDSLLKFQEVKKKLLEIENMLNNIKEEKAKEDIQLREWESEIQQAKSKLDFIDKNIFQKLEE